MNKQTAPPRSPNGRMLAEHDVVAADLIALVSGVNLASVNKVILAINVVADGLYVDPDELIEIDALPSERADNVRYANTESIARSLVTSPEALVAEPYLHFIDRMSRH